MLRRSLLVALLVAIASLGGCRKRREELPSAPAGPTNDAPPPPPPHRVAVERMLDQGYVDIYLDPRKPGVVAPDRFKNDPRLILKFGRAMPKPIPDLRVSDTGISGTLSFDEQPFFCAIPWTAVFAAVNDAGKGFVWDDRIPRELREGGTP